MADNARGPPEGRSERAANLDARGSAKRSGAHLAGRHRRGKSAKPNGEARKRDVVAPSDAEPDEAAIEARVADLAKLPRAK